MKKCAKLVITKNLQRDARSTRYKNIKHFCNLPFQLCRFNYVGFWGSLEASVYTAQVIRVHSVHYIGYRLYFLFFFPEFGKHRMTQVYRSRNGNSP